MKKKLRKRLNKEIGSCFGKVKYYNEDFANEVWLRMKNRNLLTVYKCDFCNKYHLGNIKTTHQ